VDSLTESTEYITFDFRTDSINDIQSKITKNYENVAIIQHNYEIDVYRFVLNGMQNSIVDNLETEDPNLESWQTYIDFLKWLKTERGASYIDLLACDLWANANWRYMIETVRQRDGLYIRASLDRTGEGGDFILESDNFDTIGVYFTNAILDYKYAFFAYPTANIPSGYYNYTKYVLPSTNPASITNTYSTLVGLGVSSLPVTTDVISVTANDNAIAILKTDGSVVVSGNGTFGGTMPCGVVTQSQLVNITNVVSSSNLFAALKSDKTVICWGFFNAGYGSMDINTTTDVDMINVDTVRSQLVNIVNIYANGNSAFAALNSSGAVITWGRKPQGATQPSAAITPLSSGVAKIYTASNYFVALKTNGTAVVWTGNDSFLTTTYFTNAKPITDVFLSIWSNLYGLLFVRQNGALTEITTYNGTVAYTLPAGVKVLRYTTYGGGYQDRYFVVLDNSSIILIYNGSATVYTNATDVTCTDNAYAILQNGTITVTGNAAWGGSLTDATYGLWTGATLTNPVRLVSTQSSIGVLKSDNTFVWWGKIEGSTGSKSFPTGDFSSVSTVALYNASTTNIANVYQGPNGYGVTTKSGGVASVARSNSSNYTNSVNTKPANKNIYFELLGTTFAGHYCIFVPLEIPFAPAVIPSTINQLEYATVSYYVSNPDLMAYWGRKYRLYDSNNTLLSTFTPTADTHTYVFSNVYIFSAGSPTLTIKDETTITYTVTTFQVTVLEYVYPCFLQGTRILTFNPETYQEEYVPVEKLKKGDIIPTAESGYKSIHSIGYKTIMNPKSDTNVSNRLYKFDKSKCPEVFEPLYITGEHCTLHRSLSKEKQIEIANHMGDVYITEEFYRMPAHMDDRAEPYDKEDRAETIWHFALEHENVTHNYGVYANGLLVESCAIESLLEKSGMKLV
jgi:hypothetical protein